MVKIDQKIVGVSVSKEPAKKKEEQPLPKWEPFARPGTVSGKTYKIKPPTYSDALYITINDIELPDGTRRPIEMFLNSKNMESFQWIVALTKLVSAIFRQPGDFLFMIEELKGVFDPKGGHFLPNGGGLCPSVVAHIGLIIEEHCTGLGLIEKPHLDEGQKELIDKKRAEADERGIKGTECPKCHAMAMVRLDNCETCLECGWSKCG